MLHTLRVMYVDDDRDIRTIVKISLEGLDDILLLTAASGYEALEKVVEFRPHLILLDVMMPGMDGPTTFSHLRQIPALATVPVAYVTAKVQPAEIRQLLDSGAAAVISKPFNPVRLAEQIRAIRQEYTP